MVKTRDKALGRVPAFSLDRCKRCGICEHFCPFGAIELREDGTPFLAKPEACTSCGLCEDMCPDWAVCLNAAACEPSAPPVERQPSKDIPESCDLLESCEE